MESNRNPPAVRTVVQSSSVLIDQDLVVEILKRLPIKALCRFLCVSKFWQTLISSTRFINLQFAVAHSIAPPNLKPYLRINRNRYEILVVDLYRPQPHNEPLNLAFPFQTNPMTGLYFVDSIRGVVCVSYSTNSAFDSTILWNPVIHKYVTLPLLPSPVDNFDCCVIGFGYNASWNDFIVVRVWIRTHALCKYMGGMAMGTKYEVYSSRAGMWKEGATSDVLNTCARLGVVRETGCFLNGNINWIVRGKRGSSKPRVLMFNCETQMFNIVQIPLEVLGGRTSHKLNIMEYAGMLSVVVSFGKKQTLEFWVMDDISWKKLYTFKYDNCNPYSIVEYEINDDSFMNLAPYGPKQWCEWGKWIDMFSGHVHEESMFLMDDDQAKSYN